MNTNCCIKLNKSETKQVKIKLEEINGAFLQDQDSVSNPLIKQNVHIAAFLLLCSCHIEREKVRGQINYKRKRTDRGGLVLTFSKGLLSNEQ